MDIQELFTNTTPEPPPSLLGSTLQRIRAEHARNTSRKRAFVTLGGIIVPLLVLGLNGNDLIKDIGESGMLAFASLIISNPREVLSMSNDFFLTLAESLPITSILITLVPTLAILWTIKLLSNRDLHPYGYS